MPRVKHAFQKFQGAIFCFLEAEWPPDSELSALIAIWFGLVGRVAQTASTSNQLEHNYDDSNFDD